MRLRLLSSAWLKPITVDFSPTNRSRLAAKSQSLTHSLPVQVTLVRAKESGAPSVRTKRPSRLKPATRSARLRSPVSLSPGTTADSDSRGRSRAAASTSTPVGFVPSRASGWRSLSESRFSPWRKIRASAAATTGALPAARLMVVCALTRIPLSLSTGRSSQFGWEASSTMPTLTSACADQAPSAPGRRVTVPLAILPAAQLRLKGEREIAPPSDFTGSSASISRISTLPARSRVTPRRLCVRTLVTAGLPSLKETEASPVHRPAVAMTSAAERKGLSAMMSASLAAMVTVASFAFSGSKPPFHVSVCGMMTVTPFPEIERLLTAKPVVVLCALAAIFHSERLPFGRERENLLRSDQSALRSALACQREPSSSPLAVPVRRISGSCWLRIPKRVGSTSSCALTVVRPARLLPDSFTAGRLAESLSVPVKVMPGLPGAVLASSTKPTEPAASGLASLAASSSRRLPRSAIRSSSPRPAPPSGRRKSAFRVTSPRGSVICLPTAKPGQAIPARKSALPRESNSSPRTLKRSRVPSASLTRPETA